MTLSKSSHLSEPLLPCGEVGDHCKNHLAGMSRGESEVPLYHSAPRQGSRNASACGAYALSSEPVKGQKLARGRAWIGLPEPPHGLTAGWLNPFPVAALTNSQTLGGFFSCFKKKKKIVVKKYYLKCIILTILKCIVGKSIVGKWSSRGFSACKAETLYLSHF